MKLIPLFPLQLVLFPGEKLALHIFEPRYRDLVRDCLRNDEPFGIVSYIENRVSKVGCLARIDSVQKKYDDGKYDIVTIGGDRFIIHSYNTSKTYLQGSVTTFHDSNTLEPKEKELMDSILPRFFKMIKIAATVWEGKTEPEPKNSFDFAHLIGFDLAQKQNLLEIKTETERLEFIKDHIERTLPQLEAFEEVKEMVKRNGHFKRLPPLDFNTDFGQDPD